MNQHERAEIANAQLDENAAYFQKVIETRDVAAQETVRHLQLDIERLRKENKMLRNELQFIVEELTEIGDIHGITDMTRTPTRRIDELAQRLREFPKPAEPELPA
jgi:hypothetical protein